MLHFLFCCLKNKDLTNEEIKKIRLKRIKVLPFTSNISKKKYKR